MARTRIPALTAVAIPRVGCGSGDDDAGTGSPQVAAPAEPDDDTQTADAGSGQDIGADSPGVAENISAGVGTVTIALPDGRTESRDVECSIYSDQFEVTFEYSDILDDDQSVDFYYREEGAGLSDLNFTFQDPELGGLIAKTVGAASNAAISGSSLSVDLNVLIVGSADAAGNPETADVSVMGTCAAS